MNYEHQINELIEMLCVKTTLIKGGCFYTLKFGDDLLYTSKLKRYLLFLRGMLEFNRPAQLSQVIKWFWGLPKLIKCFTWNRKGKNENSISKQHHKKTRKSNKRKNKSIIFSHWANCLHNSKPSQMAIRRGSNRLWNNSRNDF